MMPPPVLRYQHELIKLCERFNVLRLYAFGSMVGEGFDEKTSDFDFLVELLPMNPVQKGLTLLELWDALETLFHRKVDLLSEKPIRNNYLSKSIDQTKRLIYERSREKISR